MTVNRVPVGHILMVLAMILTVLEIKGYINYWLPAPFILGGSILGLGFWGTHVTIERTEKQ